MTTSFTNLSNIPNFTNILQTTQKELLYNRLNCMRIGIIEEFYPETKKAKVTIANKITVGLNKDGTQILRDFPPIYAKVYYMGWGETGITFPLTKGMEGFLLFNDREIESWYINGQINPVSYDRCHSLSDAIFICGVQSQPNLVEFVADCLNLYYKNTFIRLLENEININGNTVLTGDLTQTGDTAVTGAITSTSTITGDVLVDTTAATGTFTTADSKIVTVENGIIRSITGGS